AADKAAAEQAAADKAAADKAAAEQAAADKAKNNIDQATTADGINDAQATGITDIDNQHVPGTSVDNQKQAEKVTEDIKNDPDNKTLPEAIELPNTGVDKTESITITGVVMLILTTIFGLLFTSKKHKKD
ncbi:TPA: LPXTG cell wall anchor domain-containing protein, partial [Enterococcus faecium]